MNDPVNHPKHYCVNGVEVLDVIEAFGLGYHLGNTLKYILRAGRKGDRLEDLRKARFYLDREISREQQNRREAAALEVEQVKPWQVEDSEPE